jgi:hypothetical protein
MAERNTERSATDSSEEAAYGRSFTYWARAKPPPLPPGPDPRTSATGSTSSSSATVHRSGPTSG